MLKHDLEVDAQIEAAPYGTFQVVADGHVLVDGGPLAFAGVLPTLQEIREKVQAYLESSGG